MEIAATISVFSFINYSTCSRRDDKSRDAASLIRALKHLGRAKFPGEPRPRRGSRLDTARAHQGLEWFGTLGSLIVEINGLAAPTILVPVPSSDCTIGGVKTPSTTLLAQAVAAQTRNASVADSLRWRRERKPSHLGGTREPHTLFRELFIVSTPPQGTLILIDDVVTTGGHILAAAAKLATVQRPCSLAICVGRTVAAKEHYGFSIVGKEFARSLSLLKKSRRPVGCARNLEAISSPVSVTSTFPHRAIRPEYAPEL
jgi:hypothetical protein